MQANKSEHLPLIGGLSTGEVRDLPADLVAKCRNWQQAVALCVNSSRVKRTQRSWADLMGVSAGTWNTILNSDRAGRERHLPLDWVPEIQNLAGNRAIEQYLTMRRLGLLDCQRSVEDEKAALRLRLAQLEGQA